MLLAKTDVPEREAIWNFAAQPLDAILRCPLCNAPKHAFRFESDADRYGYAQRSVTCARCGLNFLNPRMTREAYARFYETAYRPLVSAFHGREINAQTIQPEQREYGRYVAGILESWVYRRGRSLLDVGGSTGVVARVLAERLNVYPTVLDPSPYELEEARRTGAVLRDDGYMHMVMASGFIEDYQPDGSFDLITLCQTADHLLDLMGSLRKIKSLLSKDGLFWSDIVDFDVTREVKIDHPFNLTEKTYREFLKRAGFNLLQINYAPDGKHIGFLAR